MKIAGLDIGTTGCKLTVFDESGSELGMQAVMRLMWELLRKAYLL